jgi:putative glutamine amidotransferase
VTPFQAASSVSLRHPRIGMPTADAGLPANLGLASGPYAQAIELGDGAPAPIPLTEDEGDLRWRYDGVDGICLLGGGDVAAERYGSKRGDLCKGVRRDRDAVEFALCRWALAEGKPLLAICRGLQVLNVAACGTLIEDIPTLVPRAHEHHIPGTHTVHVQVDSLLARWLGVAPEELSSLPVNSRHHQAIRDLGRGLRVTALAADEVIEAVEGPADGPTLVVGIQWHPENMAPTNAAMRGLFAGFCALCARGGASQ